MVMNVVMKFSTIRLLMHNFIEVDLLLVVLGRNKITSFCQLTISRSFDPARFATSWAASYLVLSDSERC